MLYAVKYFDILDLEFNEASFSDNWQYIIPVSYFVSGNNFFYWFKVAIYEVSYKS